MKRTIAAVAISMASIFLWVAPAQTAPEPSPVPSSWQLDVALHEPQAISLNVGDGGKSQTFWFLRYTVSNNTGSDRTFIPDFVLFTDTGQTLRGGRDVPPGVFEAIQSRLNDPLLRDSVDISGRLLEGEDNARSGLAIWPDYDGSAGGFSVFIGHTTPEQDVVKAKAG